MIPPEFQAQVIVCTNGKVLERMEMIKDGGPGMDGWRERKKENVSLHVESRREEGIEGGSVFLCVRVSLFAEL